MATVKVADHMLVQPNVAVGTLARALANTRMDGTSTQHVSMAGANAATLDINVHVLTPVGAEVLECWVEGSNDRSNWFAITGSQPPAPLGVGKLVPPLPVTGIGFAWIRVVFAWDAPAGAPGVGSVASVTCDLNTSLL